MVFKWGCTSMLDKHSCSDECKSTQLRSVGHPSHASWLPAPAGLTSTQQPSALEGLHEESPSDEEAGGSDSSDEEGEGEEDLSSSSEDAASSEDEAEADGPAPVRQPSGQEVVHAGGRKRRSALL